jgi:hypothetical protein
MIRNAPEPSLPHDTGSDLPRGHHPDARVLTRSSRSLRVELYNC